jgi:2-polyprenyl-6-methoxyphenol hydroxylase-like FAD-dependent oxidoreductase
MYSRHPSSLPFFFFFFFSVPLFLFNHLFSVQLEQGTVTSLLEENGTVRGVQYKSKDGQEHKAYAPLTIVCDGCFSNLRRTLCNPKVKLPSTI